MLYDFRGLLTSVTLAAGTSQAVTTVYAYDEWGNLLAQTDAANHTTSFAYDALGRRVSRTLPGTQTETMVYDVSGNVLQQTNFNGVVITNGYDGMNRLTNRWSTNEVRGELCLQSDERIADEHGGPERDDGVRV